MRMLIGLVVSDRPYGVLLLELPELFFDFLSVESIFLFENWIKRLGFTM